MIFTSSQNVVFKICHVSYKVVTSIMYINHIHKAYTIQYFKKVYLPPKSYVFKDEIFNILIYILLLLLMIQQNCCLYNKCKRVYEATQDIAFKYDNTYILCI